MKTIAFLNQKGGAGKTTLALGVAATLAASGSRVLLIDADPQGSATDWNAGRGDRPAPFALVRLDRPVLHRELPTLSAGYDYTLIDGPARDAALQRSALLAADLVAVPAQPSGLDLWASDAFLSLVKEAHPFAPAAQRVALVLSRSQPRGALARGIREALCGLGWPVVDGTTERSAYREAVTAGLTIPEFAAQPGRQRDRAARAAAVAELTALTTALLSLPAPSES